MKFLIRALLGAVFDSFVARDRQDRADGEQGRRRANWRLFGCLFLLLTPVVLCGCLMLSPFVVSLGAMAGIIPSSPSAAQLREEKERKKEANAIVRERLAKEARESAIAQAEARKLKQQQEAQRWKTIPQPWAAEKQDDDTEALWRLQLPADDLLKVGFRTADISNSERICMISKSDGGFTRPINGGEPRRWFLPPATGEVTNAIDIPQLGGGSLLVLKTHQWLLYNSQEKEFVASGAAPSDEVADLKATQLAEYFACKKDDKWLLINGKDQSVTKFDDVLDFAVSPTSISFAYCKADGSLFLSEKPPSEINFRKHDQLHPPADILAIGNGIFTWGGGVFTVWEGRGRSKKVEFPADEVVGLTPQLGLHSSLTALTVRRGEEFVVAVTDQTPNIPRVRVQYTFTEPVVHASINKNGQLLLILTESGVLRLFRTVRRKSNHQSTD